MIQVNVTTNVDGDVLISFNGLDYTFLIGSKAQYLPNGGILTLVDATGKAYNFHEDAYEFIINSVLWVGTFSALAQEFNKNIFIGTTISPPPGSSATIRTNAILTGAYVATTLVDATGRSQVHFDFDITDGGTLADSGNVIAMIQVSDDGTNWLNLNNVVAASALVADGAAVPFQSGTVFRQFTAEYAAIAIPYDSSNLPSLPIRISYQTGYGRFYRLQVRASDTGGVSTGAPATFPDLEIKVSLQ